MEVYYKECQKRQNNRDRESDGCQEFMGDEISPLTCVVCGCHRNFHRKEEIVYNKCEKIHENKHGRLSVDGCQVFHPGGKEDTEEALKCAACGCHKSFHRSEVRKWY